MKLQVGSFVLLYPGIYPYSRQTFNEVGVGLRSVDTTLRGSLILNAGQTLG